MNVLKIVITSFILFFCSTLYSNPAPFGGAGKTIQPMAEHKYISLVEEEVHIKEYVDGSQAQYVRVAGFYALQNTSNKSIKMKIGFPVVIKLRSKDMPEIIDGELQKFEVIIKNQNVKLSTIDEDNVSKQDKKGYIKWYIWNVAFKPKELVYMRVVYESSTEHFGWDRAPTFTYILKTGAKWKGKIKKLKVVFKPYDSIDNGKKLAVTPKSKRSNFNFKKNEAIFTLKDCKPDFNFNITKIYDCLEGNWTCEYFIRLD